MVTWSDLQTEAPEIAELGAERIAATGLVLVGTLRQDGWPRISPVEPVITGGVLYLGMMWQSRKALDLLRDARCLVHTSVSAKDGTEGEVKLYGMAIAIDDPDERDRYGVALYEAIGWRPEDDKFHLFALDIDEAAAVQFGDGGQRVAHWRPGQPVTRFTKATP